MEPWRSESFPMTVACGVCTVEMVVDSPDVIPFLACDVCGSTPCGRLCGKWFQNEDGATKHTMSCGRAPRRAARRRVARASPPRRAQGQGARAEEAAAPRGRQAPGRGDGAEPLAPRRVRLPPAPAAPRRRARRRRRRGARAAAGRGARAAGARAARAGVAARAAFVRALDGAFASLGGRERVEHGGGVRGNLAPDASVCSSGQRDAHYGAVLPNLVAHCLSRARLAAGETFVDVGSGLGAAVLQAALTTTCARAVGVEVVRSRHDAALAVRDATLTQLPPAAAAALEARAELRLGDAFDAATADFLSSCDVLLVNNANGTMAPERVAVASHRPLDEQLANVAKRCRVGARLVAMDTIPLLDAAALGGAFDRLEFDSGPLAVSWTDGPVPLVLYTKRKVSWTCPRCTFENPLFDDFAFITECALCPDELRAKFNLTAGDMDGHRPKRRCAKKDG
ncbi:hypothetical protein SO694_00191034 [Aureococcus anophagefferens]|uniref:Histone-lysine N-methyltransferase, H3 lysine-79 specific n=1 Tax=Aureococcus anophagefferens TaxID=44056 RepID=A0ABR1FP16_AURAN